MSLLSYIKGFRKGKDARRIEIDAMNDPFLAEAIEGYDSVKGNHMDRIAQLQKQISARTKSGRSKRWIPYTAAAAVLVGAVFFAVLNSPVDEAPTDSDIMYVYVTEAYVEKKKMEGRSSSVFNVVTEVKNLEILAPDEEIEIFIPEEYVVEKRMEFSSDNKQENSSVATKVTATITNIDEIFVSDDVLEIYLPDSFLEKERNNINPRVRIKDIGDF